MILGDLGEGWTYGVLQEAFEYVMGGASIIALSRDRYWQRGDRLALDAGPFVAALEYATGVDAAVAGKPSPAFYAAALASLGVSAPGGAAMVGDDLWSDVQGAQRAGLEGWLVRTGKFREETLRDSGITPNRVLSSVAALARSVSRMAGYLSPLCSDWSEVAGPAGPAVASCCLPVVLSAQSATDSGSAPPSDSTVIRAIQLERRDVFDPAREGLAGAGGERAPLRDPGADRSPGAALRRRRAVRLGPRRRIGAQPPRRWASFAGCRSIRCRPTRAW